MAVGRDGDDGRGEREPVASGVCASFSVTGWRSRRGLYMEETLVSLGHRSLNCELPRRRDARGLAPEGHGLAGS